MKSLGKRLFICVVLLGVAALGGVLVYGNCGSTVLVGNITGYQPSITGTPDTSLMGKFWQVGNSAAANSGTLTTASMITSYLTGYYVWTDWVNSGAVGCPGTPPAAGTRNAFLYSIANGGTAKYLVMSVAVNGAGQFNYGDITNGPSNTPSSVLVPTPSSRSSVAVAGGYDYTLNWTPLTQAQRLGYYDVAPTNNVVTGIAVYYTTAAGPISNFNRSAWTLASGGPSSRTGYVSFPGIAASTPDPGTATVFVPTGTTFIAFSALFDGGIPGDAVRETLFVSPSVASPTGAGLFVQQSASVSGGMVTVNWTTNVESGVAQFQVFSSVSKGGTYLPVSGTVTAPKGNSSSYSVTFPKLGSSSSTLYLKIKASKMNGPDEWSELMKIGS